MRKLHLGAPVIAHARTDIERIEAKVDWCIAALEEVSRASHDIDPFQVADGFTVTNLTEDRTLDADSTTLAEVADVLGTLIQDLSQRGAKRTTG